MSYLTKYTKSAKMTMMAKIFLTTTEVAEMLGVSSQTVRNWIDRGILKAYRLNPSGMLLIRQEDLDNAIEKGSYDNDKEY